MMSWQRCLLLATYLLTAALGSGLLSACSSISTQWNPDDYTVKSGDTLYSLAWRYELDTEEFAAWNGISTSTFIKPGQRLHTRKPADYDDSKKYDNEQAVAYVPKSRENRDNANAEKDLSYKKWVKAEKGDTLYGISRQYGVSIEKLAQLNQLNKPYVIKPGQTIFLKPLSTASSSGKKKTPKTSPKATSTGRAATKKRQETKPQSISWPTSVSWQRPAKGRVVKKFSRWRNDSKGIDIAGNMGDAIVAAADGQVVYSGNGLISYGNLIIIKHNKTYLSAYAYNRKLLVKEGGMVKAGQQIAEMGHKDKQSPRLHFEIRKNGKPVDPLKYLPW
jgi:lipoprotein NlpD